MKRLPVPDLEPTLDCLLGVVRPIVDDDQFAATKTSVEEFAAGDGPRCQQDLLAFADEQHAQGESWFSRVWLSGYLGVRTPLPLTSNVGFQLRMDTESTGLDRAAEIAHRLAAVHLAHVRGDLT
ncbi:MAG: acyltransferase, partial [Micrococcales bacterium]